MSYRVIVADNQELFRVGTARLLGVEDDFHIVGQCSDAASLLKAAESFSGATIFCASSMASQWGRIKRALDALSAKTVIVLENQETPDSCIKEGFEGILYRSVAPSELIACVRTVATGGRHHQAYPASQRAPFEPDALGQRARQRLTPKELKIVSLLVQGCSNREIAEKLGNTEQVIKNYMRSIFDKTGVADRLELALFTIHHRVLLDSAAPAPSKPVRAIHGIARSEATHELVPC